jgi:predicted DsbA family dithiol-disulfide isomerase
VRLHRLSEEIGPDLVVASRAFPLRPTPEPGAAFTGTYREEGWRRCGALSAGDGLTFTPWPHGALPGWSLPALEAAKCVAKQGEALFARLHLKLYDAYFRESRNIGDPHEVIRIVGECDGVDVDRFVADYRAGRGRDAVLSDYEAAVTEHGVRSIPTVIAPVARRALVGLAEAAAYRALVEDAASA